MLGSGWNLSEFEGYSMRFRSACRPSTTPRCERLSALGLALALRALIRCSKLRGEDFIHRVGTACSYCTCASDGCQGRFRCL